MITAHDAASAEQNAIVGVLDAELGNADIASFGAQIVKLRVDPVSVVLHHGRRCPLLERMIVPWPQLLFTSGAVPGYDPGSASTAAPAR